MSYWISGGYSHCSYVGLPAGVENPFSPNGEFSLDSLDLLLFHQSDGGFY